MIIIIFSIGISSISFFAILYLYYYSTGRYKRTYESITFNESINFNSSSIQCKNLLEIYKPIVYQENTLRGPKPQKIYAECIRGSSINTIVLVYRIYWKTEEHPRKIFDKLYILFRSAFYGSKADIEFIQLRLNANQKLIEIKFESDPSNDPDVLSPQHLLASFTLEVVPGIDSISELNELSWILTYNNKRYQEKKLIFEKIGNNSPATHLAIRVFTWNHIYALTQDFTGCQSFDLPLEELTESIYQNLKMSRRSCADYCRTINRKKSILQAIFFICNPLIALYSLSTNVLFL